MPSECLTNFERVRLPRANNRILHELACVPARRTGILPSDCRDVLRSCLVTRVKFASGPYEQDRDNLFERWRLRPTGG